MDSTSSSLNTPGRNKDIDFNDVFGGPPRRSSSQESDETVATSSQDLRSGLSEKPVFGKEAMSRRRRYSKNDFFDDIFRGNESLSSSLRKYEMKDPFAPGLQLMSPARPLPPKAEPFESSFPAQFSLPAKLSKGMDLPAFGSLTQSASKSKDGSSNGLSYYGCSPMSRFSGQANQDKEELRKDCQSLNCFSALSQELNIGAEESTNLTNYVETETKGHSKEDSSGSEILKNGSHFHFSIYKWASKGGVPVALPFRGSDRPKEKDKLQRCSSANGWLSCESMAKEPNDGLDNSFCSTDRVSSNAKSFRNAGSLIDSRNEDGERGRIIDKDNISKSESEIIFWLKSTDKNVSGNTILHSSGGDEKTDYSLSQIDVRDKQQREVSAVGKATHMPQPKPLNLFFDDDYDDEQGNDEITRNAGRKDMSEKSAKKLSEILDGKNIKKQDIKRRATSNNVETSTTNVKHSPRNSCDNGKGGVRGKVKEFIKMFNQDASSKPGTDVLSESRGFSRKERDTVKPKNEPSTSTSKRFEKIHLNNMPKKKSSPDIPVANFMSNGASEKNINNSVKDIVSNGSKTIIEDPAESLEENFLTEDLTPEKKISPQLGIDPEEIKAIDAKIRQWSNGTQGNIRSLLSTLQYVLWPDSGWKPVPLVDVIEGPAVKRSYQKALLCLHPDKLQQKGAASEKKYIAEKVFGILQDAWTHFNSLGSV